MNERRCKIDGCTGTLDDSGLCPVCFNRDPDAAASVAGSTPSSGSELVRAMATAEATIAAATTESDQIAALESWEEKAVDLYLAGYRFVTLIGFSQAGKSFFANRIRFELDRRGWNVSPRAQRTIEKTDAKIEVTELNRKGRLGSRRVVADCDGEAYRKSVADLLASSQDGSHVNHARRYLTMTLLASAYVLMVPANLKFGKQENDLSSQFDLIVKTILALHRRLRETGDVRSVIKEGLRKEDVAAALQNEFSSNRPLLVLFTQADRFAEVRHATTDPLTYAMTSANALFREIDNRFTTYRFDFVSAFAGHPVPVTEVMAVAGATMAGAAGMVHQTGAMDTVVNAGVDYNRGHSGVIEAFDWIDSAIERPRRWRYATRAAVLARRAVDWEFHRLCRESTR